MEHESVPKQPISSGEAKQKLLYYLADLQPEKLEAYFEVFDVPEDAVKDAEVQAAVDEWLKELPQVSEKRLPKHVANQMIDVLNRLFKN